MSAARPSAILAAVTMFLLPIHAEAAIYFRWDQTGPVLYDGDGGTGPVPARVRGRIALDEARLADGFNVSLSHTLYGERSGIRLDRYGIVSFYLDVVRTDGVSPSKVMQVVYTDFANTRSAYFHLDIVSVPDGVPDIHFSWQDQDQERGVAFTTVDGVVQGEIAGLFPFRPDVGGPIFDEGCYSTGACTFTGRLTTRSLQVAIPAPPAIGLTAFGLVALAVARARRRPA